LFSVEPSIDALITLSSNVMTLDESHTKTLMNTDKYGDDLELLLESSNTHNQTELQEIFDQKFLKSNHNLISDDQTWKICRDAHKSKNIKHPDTDVIPELSRNEPSKKVGTESLCGLKVQYRLKGTEYSDDDADVVIEEEFSDYRIETPEPERVSVCQFLSAHTQCPPRNTFPKVFNFALFVVAISCFWFCTVL
jgi:hypothetical protein